MADILEFQDTRATTRQDTRWLAIAIVVSMVTALLIESVVYENDSPPCGSFAINKSAIGGFDAIP